VTARVGEDGFTNYDSRRDTTVGGRAAVCWTGTYTSGGLFSAEGTYTVGCIVDVDLGPQQIFSVNVRVNPATYLGGTVPDHARQLADALFARITESLTFN
jgi:hypothetical protein